MRDINNRYLKEKQFRNTPPVHKRYKCSNCNEYFDDHWEWRDHEELHENGTIERGL